MKKQYIYEGNLQSERLVTRKLADTDIPIWQAFFEDHESIEFLYLYAWGLNSSFEFSDHMIKKQMDRYRMERFGHQALLEKDTGDFIGLCGLLAQEIEGKEEVEVGYHILKKYRGKGYATEAARIFIDYAFKNALTTSIISVIDIRNFKSQKVAEKNGLTIEKQTKWLDKEDVYIYRITSENWINNRNKELP